MSRTNIAVFVGTRPEIIKMAPIIKGLRLAKWANLVFTHTGQHYDWELSTVFLKELNLPNPDNFMAVGSYSHGEQTARTMERAERILKLNPPGIVLVEGDTNSVLGVALAAVKLRIPVGHVEAGCRCFDKTMPEEINRVLVADCSKFHFAPTKTCVNNLRMEGIPASSIYQTGHPLVDLVNDLRGIIDRDGTFPELGLKCKEYALLTVHREENADNPRRLRGIVRAIQKIGIPVVFPIHPRTNRNLKRFRIPLGKIETTKPLGYVHTLNLIQNARVVFTDSGGVQQEACMLSTPCITLRLRTEWMETVRRGVNFLSSPCHGPIELYRMVARNNTRIQRRFGTARYIFGRGGSASRILRIVRYEMFRNHNKQDETIELRGL